MSCWGVNMFQPGLSAVRCAKPAGVSRRHKQKRPKPARVARASCCDFPRDFLLDGFLTLPHAFTAASKNDPRELGWQFLFHSYFSTWGMQKEKARVAGAPGRGVKGKGLGNLNYRAVRGEGSGADVAFGASAALPLRAGTARAAGGGSGFRAGMARFSPSRTKVKRSCSLFQSMQTRSPR